MIRSIFGLTTEDVRKQQQELQQSMAQQYATQTNANPGVASFGTAIGAGLGRGLMSRLGFEDPEMAKAQDVEARQAALDKQLAALEPDDPRRQWLLAEALSNAGNIPSSIAAADAARQMETAVALREAEQSRAIAAEAAKQEQIRQFEKNYRLDEQRLLLQEKQENKLNKKSRQEEANIGRAPEVIEIKDKNGNVVSLELRTWNNLGEEKRSQITPSDLTYLLQALGQNNKQEAGQNNEQELGQNNEQELGQNNNQEPASVVPPGRKRGGGAALTAANIETPTQANVSEEVLDELLKKYNPSTGK